MRAKDYRMQAWAALKGNWKTYAVITLIYMLISSACSAVPTVGMLAALVISGPFTVAFAMISLKVLRAEGIEVSNLFDGFQNFKNTFLLGLLNFIFILLWSFLLIIPGIIKAYSYSMSTYILADNPEMEQAEARKASIEMMNGHKWELFCLHFSFIGWHLLIPLTLGILSFWVTPYVQTATAAFYENLKNQAADVVA